MDNVYGKDDPQISRQQMMDALNLPLSNSPTERWEIAEEVLIGVETPQARTRTKKWLMQTLENSMTCETIEACIKGCTVPFPKSIPLRKKGIIPLYFASGSNNAGEIKGFAASGMHLGVAVPVIYKENKSNIAARNALKGLAGTQTKVFVDSGAFGEIGFKNGVPYDKHPITPSEWKKRLATYVELAKVLGNQVYLVAPDKIADQEATLDRLIRYMPILQPVLKGSFTKRANLIVPIQKGQLSMIDFDRKVRKAVGSSNFIRGIPMKKDATTLSQLIAFVKELYKDKSVKKPLRLHLLGKGRTSVTPDWSKHIRPELEKIDPAMDVTLDSVRLRSIASRGGKKRQQEAIEKVKQRRTPAMSQQAYQREVKKALKQTERKIDRSKR